MHKNIRMFGCLVTVAGLLGLGACASTYNASLDEARAALDGSDYTTAVAQSTAALAEVPGDFDATMLLSAAYAGRAGINLIDMAKLLVDTSASNTFSDIHGIFVLSIGSTGLADLRSAITTLTSFSGTAALSTSKLADYNYQLGILHSVEIFARSTILAKPTTTATTDTSLITSADSTIAAADFVAADGELIAGGIAADNQLVTTIRQNYCALADISAGSGFTVAELRALTLCELSTTAVAATLTAADLGGAVTGCSDFNFSCTAVDTQ